MTSKFVARDFLLKDVAISLGAGSHGTTWLPDPDGVTPPTPISPVAAVLNTVYLTDAVRGVIRQAMEKNDFSSVTEALAPGATGGDPVIRTTIHEIGTAVVTAVGYTALVTGHVDGGDWGEKIPTPATPYVHFGMRPHTISELPRLRKQLAEAMTYLDKVAKAHTPRSEEVEKLRSTLEELAPALA